MIFSDIDLLLDVSTIKKNDKLIIEHSIEWISQTIIAQGYDFSEPEQINKDNGKKLELTLNYSYIYSRVCKRYITVDDDNLKIVILRINKTEYMDDTFIFDIKYYIEKYQIPIPIPVDDEENSKTDKKETDNTDKTDNIVPYVPFDKTKTEGVDYSEINFILGSFVNLLIAAGLSAPNIIVYIIRSKRGKKNPSSWTLFLNILMHLGLGGLIMKIANANITTFQYVLNMLTIFIVMIPTILVLLYSFGKDKQYELFKSFECL